MYYAWKVLRTHDISSVGFRHACYTLACKFGKKEIIVFDPSFQTCLRMPNRKSSRDGFVGNPCGNCHPIGAKKVEEKKTRQVWSVIKWNSNKCITILFYASSSETVINRYQTGNSNPVKEAALDFFRECNHKYIRF